MEPVLPMPSAFHIFLLKQEEKGNFKFPDFIILLMATLVYQLLRPKKLGLPLFTLTRDPLATSMSLPSKRTQNWTTSYNVRCHQPGPSHHLSHLDDGSSISSDPPASTPACVRVTVNLAVGVILWKQCGFDHVTQLLRVLSWFFIFLRL